MRLFRYLREFNLPNRNLRFGSTGDAVVLLQDALKILDFNCGTSDGIYGLKTELKVKELQASSDSIEVTGVVGKETRTYIQEQLK